MGKDGGMATRSLWVGNVDPTLNEDDLAGIFSQFGDIESIRMLPDKECAFINYTTVQSAMDARNQMQGGRVGSCIVKVGFGRADTATSMGEMPPSRALWVGNLSPNMAAPMVLGIFEPFGPVESLRLLPHKNCGFVNFYHIEHAVMAKRALNGQYLDGMCLRTGFAKAPPDFRPDGSMGNYAPDPYGRSSVVEMPPPPHVMPAMLMPVSMMPTASSSEPLLSSPKFTLDEFPAVGQAPKPINSPIMPKRSLSTAASEVSDLSACDANPTSVHTHSQDEGSL